MVRDGPQVEGRRAGADDVHIRTFLIADVRGYTVFTQERGDEAAAELAGKFAAVAREGVEARGGVVVELRGDEALAVFDSARQAIRASIELQRRFVDETIADPTLPLAVGIGLDAGEAVGVEGGYRGGALNLAARLCGIAGPGEILASPAVTHLARKVDGVAYVERGAVHLKGLADRVHVIRLRAEADDAAEDMAFRRALGSRAARLTPTVPGAILANPYKGLRAFEEGDAQDFFGREELVEQLVKRLGQTRFLAVVGPSGSGKSSVVRAGLLPAVRRGAIPGSEGWRIADMFPDVHPLDGLEAALLRASPDPPPSLIEQLERDEHGLHRAVLRLLPTDGSELVLVIDQFEEVFTLVEDEAVRTHFLGSLEAAVRDPHSRLRVVATLRADFYDRPLLYRGFAELFKSRVEAVIPLSAEELERAISGPAKRVDLSLEPGLVAAMLADVAEEPGALPLMEYALTELFERRDGRVLFLEAYREIGGVSGALGRRAEELYAELDHDGKEAARQLFLRLVALGEGTEDTRRRVPRSDVASLDVDQHAMTIVLDTFGASRQLSFDRDPGTGAPTIELAHEAMLTAWPRLHRWIDAARDDLRTERRVAAAAREWIEAGRDASFLLGGSRLEQAEAWQAASGLAVTPEEREYLEASRTERERRSADEEARRAHEKELERRSFRRLRALVAVLAAASLVAVALTVFATNQRERAEREERTAIARELATASVANLEVDAERSVLLAIEAVRTSRSSDGIVLPEAEEALHRAVQADRLELTIATGASAVVRYSPDGSRVLSPGPEPGTATVYDAATGEIVLTLPRHGTDELSHVNYSPDGRFISTSSRTAASTKIWDARSGREVFELTVRSGDPVCCWAEFSPDGSMLASNVFDGTVRLWDLTTGAPIGLVNAAGALGFSPDGSRLWVDTCVWELETSTVAVEPSCVDLAPDEFVTDVSWPRESARVATSTTTGTVILWDADTGDEMMTLVPAAGDIRDIELAPGGDRLALGTGDGTARMWDLSETAGHESFVLAGHDAGIQSMKFRPDGARLATASEDGAIKVWDVTLEAGGEAYTRAGAGALAYSPASSTLAMGDTDGTVRLYDVQSNEPLRTLGDPGAPIVEIATDPGGTRLAAASERGTVTVWDVTTGTQIVTVRAHPPVMDLAVNAEARLVAALSGDQTAQIWDASSGRPVRTLRGVYNALAFSGDGTRLAAPFDPGYEGLGRVRVWDTDTWSTVQTVTYPPFSGDLVFNANAGLLTVVGVDGKVRVFDTETWGVRSMTGNLGRIWGVTSDAGGRTIATASEGGLHVWDVDRGRVALELNDVPFPPPADVDLAFSPDGTRLAAPTTDGGVTIYVLDIDELLRVARAEVTRGFTDQECRQFLHVPECPPS